MTSLIAFLSPADSLARAYTTHYDPLLVALSVAVAAFASFAAFQVAERLRAPGSVPIKILWQGIGGLAMGGGVWAMHFIGMLALSLPCAVFYDPAITFASMLPGVLASAAALNVMKRRRPAPGPIALGGLLMGGGIGAMHYAGMAAMRIDGLVRYDPVLFGLSIVVAAALAGAALYVKFLADARFVAHSHALSNGAGAILMGAAIAGMHYTAMLAAYFLPGGEPPTGAMALNPVAMGVAIGGGAILITALVLAAALLGRHLDTIAQLRRVVAERVRAEAEARKFLRAVEQSSASIVISDGDGMIEYVNPRFTEVTGYALDEVRGKNPNILQSGRTEDAIYDDLWRTILDGREWQGELLNRRKSGELYWDRTLIAPIRDAAGAITNFVAVKEDVTERKAMERDLIEARDEAETANRLKTSFLANISHELRTPLSSVIGFAEMMVGGLRGPLPGQYREYAENILAAGRQELAIVNSLLDMARIEAGRMPFADEVIHIRGVARDAFLLVEAEADNKGLALVEACAEDHRVRGDSQHLLRILVNLLTNAVAYTEKGSVTVATAVDEGGLRLTVADTGVGMTHEQIRHALEPFSRVEADAYVRTSTGVGLGLPMVLHLTALYQGRVDIASAPGRGTTVTVRFPLERSVAGA